MTKVLDRIWLFFSSVRLTIVLLIALAAAMAYGTWIETSLSNGAARILIYSAWWFDSLIGLLALNLIGCTLRRAPYKPHQIGWITTHIALLLIMAGAVLTHRFGIQGRMMVPEGESENVYYLEELDRSQMQMVSGQALLLPFAVHLEKFDQVFYPGSGMTRMYRSRVRVLDPESSDTLRHDIVLNHPLIHQGFKLSQSSFSQLADGRTVTVLGVSYDPGIPLLYIGSILLVLGMAGIFFLKPYLKRKFPPNPVRRDVPLAEHTEMTRELEEHKAELPSS